MDEWRQRESVTRLSRLRLADGLALEFGHRFEVVRPGTRPPLAEIDASWNG